jgi:methionyl-tRNA formyltransferase
VTKPPLVHSFQNKKIQYQSSVHLLGDEYRIPVYSPLKATDKDFLSLLRDLQPDLCVTAAYGNYLPIKFLQIPKYGTINIHPSLLPRYRGASPVQRSLVNGDEVVGVTVLYTVKEMDAGPMITQSSLRLQVSLLSSLRISFFHRFNLFPPQGHEKNTEVLSKLFQIGTRDLLQSLPKIFSSTPPSPLLHDSSPSLGTPQDHSLATQAPKIHHSEGNIDFQTLTATQIHNRSVLTLSNTAGLLICLSVCLFLSLSLPISRSGRGFSDWPGIWCLFHIQGPSRDDHVRVRLITTRVLPSSSSASSPPPIDPTNEISYHPIPGTKDGYFEVTCKDNSRLGILELQPQGKKVMTAKAFKNGLKEKKVSCSPILGAEMSHIQPDRDSSSHD